MLPNRALVATVLTSSILWVGLGAAGEALAYRSGSVAAGAALLLPASVPTALWFGTTAEVLGTAVLAGVVHAAVLALLLRVVLRRTAPGVVPIWFAVLVTGFVASGVLALGSLIGDPSSSGLRALVGQMVALLAPAGLWGVVWGWLPALVGARLARGSSAAPRRGPTLAAAALVAAAAAAALLVLPTFGRVQPTPIAAPSPSITHLGWAGIAPVAPQGAVVAADACSADDVSVSADTGDAATGHRALGIHARNDGDTACTLDGYADVVFDDAEGDAMDVLVTRGGSFMTTDAGKHRIRLAPGASARAELGWNAQSAAGEQRAGTLFVSVHPGDRRLPVPVDLDIKDGGAVALTAWHAEAA